MGIFGERTENETVLKKTSMVLALPLSHLYKKELNSFLFLDLKMHLYKCTQPPLKFL